MPKRILSVGQCLPDQSSITRFLQHHFDVEVQTADTAEEAMAMIYAGPFDLVLVNRIFDADGAPGLEFLRDLKADPTSSRVPVMLVSNLSDAQERAVASGAVPGFGKSELGSSDLINRLSPHFTASPEEE